MIYFAINYKSLFTTAFFMLLIIAYALLQPLLLALYIFIVFGVIFSNVATLCNMAGIEKNISIVLVVVLTIMLPISSLRNETAILHYIIVLVSLGSAYVLTRDPYVYLSASRYSLILTQSIILGFLYFSGLEAFPLENLLPSSSSNAVTSYLILLQANYSIVNFIFNRGVSLLTSLVTLFICFIGYGRGSILSAFAILIVVAIFSVPLRRPTRAFFYSLFLLVIGLSGLIFFGLEVPSFSQIIEFVNLNTKIGHGLSDGEGRMLMINDYLSRINILTFFVGASYEGTIIELLFYGNPHNSYIRAHHFFGFIYILLMVLMPLVLFRRRRAAVDKIFCGIIILILFFRAFTEPILFPTPFDFYYFSIIFIFSNNFPNVVFSGK